MTRDAFDIVVVGGGIAGSVFGGVAARAGLGVLIVEKEPQFRDRVRGEATHPWGVHEAMRLGLADLLLRARVQYLPFWQSYTNQLPNPPFEWSSESVGGCSLIGFSHTKFQEEAIRWAADQGAAVVRPAKAVAFRPGASHEIFIVSAGQEYTVQTGLIVGADGRTSMTRAWVGAETLTDPEHHRFGGGLFSGLALSDDSTHEGSKQGLASYVFPRSDGNFRVYVVAPDRVVSAAKGDRLGQAFAALAAGLFPLGAFASAWPTGPVAFFSNAEVWPSQIAGDRVVLIGDAAGSSDPSRGHGTSLIFRDVRELSELLLDSRRWQQALTEFERRRRTYFETIRQITMLSAIMFYEHGEIALRRRERHERAKLIDPTLGGILLLEARGPDGLVVDEAARRLYLGEDFG